MRIVPRVHEKAQCIILDVIGHLDSDKDIIEFQEALRKQSRGQIRKVILYLNDLSYISEQAAGRFRRSCNIIQSSQGQIALAGVKPEVLDKIRKHEQLAGHNDQIPAYASELEALESFSQA